MLLWSLTVSRNRALITRGEEGSHVSLTSTLEQLLPNYLNEDSGYVRYEVLACVVPIPDMSQCAS